MRVRRGFIVSLGALLTMSVLAILQVPPSKEDVLPTQAGWTSVKNARVVDEAVKKHQAVAAYGKLPLNFEANQGQADDAVKFLARGNGYTLFLTSTEAVLSLTHAPAISGEESARSRTDKKRKVGTTLRIKLIGANSAPQVQGVGELPGKSNYFIGNDPKRWHIDVPTYAKVKYEDVYPGVDLLYYADQRQLEHDFVVAAGADPKTIELQVQGARSTRLDDQGDLVLETGGGEFRLCKPRIYQDVKGARQEIAGGYVLRGKRRVGFEVTAYDDSKPLVIDPALSYSTYFGGSGNDFGFGIAVDTSGNAYVTGATVSTNFPTTTGVFQTAFAGGGNDAFVAKIDTTKTGAASLIYSTYVGGGSDDVALAIAVDSNGNAYVTGSTLSTNFPTTTGAFQTAFSGRENAFVTKLNATGSALLYSTYLGGSGIDFGVRIATDASGNAYVTGRTTSINFPTTVGVFQTTFAGGTFDAFVAKLNPTGSGLVYSTYLGGNSDDAAFGIAVDSNGNAYVTGSTTSINFPTTVGVFQTALSGPSDAFLTKVNPAGAALVYSTYLGGNSGDSGLGIAVDSAGNAYVTGSTSSTNFPTTPGAFRTIFGGGAIDAFVMKLNAAGSVLVYSTYLGGSGNDSGVGIATDSSGNAYVTGQTSSGNFPITSMAFQTAFNGGNTDGFMTKLNGTGSALLYSTYLGGGGDDEGLDIAVDSAGNGYLTGLTASTNFPTTTGAFQTAFRGGGDDAFIAKFAFGPAVTVSPTNLSFGSQNDGTTSAPLTVTLTNTGEAQLTITGIAIGGPNSGDFAQANICGSSVAAGANCTIAVTFSPTAPGARNGTLTITDNAADSPQTVTLTGTGTGDFSLRPAPGGSTTATVTAGQTATFNLQVVPSGFNGTVMLTCSGAPAAATCSVSPTSVTLNGTTASPFSMSVATTARSVVAPWTETVRIRPVGGLRIGLPVLLALALLAMLACLVADRRLKPTIALPTGMVLLALLLIGCSGGTSTGTSTPKGTPPGTSTLTVNGTSGSVNRNIMLTLTVN